MIIYFDNRQTADADGSLIQLWLETQRYWVRSPVRWNDCHWGCAHTVLEAFQRTGVHSALHDTVQNKNPLKSFDSIRA